MFLGGLFDAVVNGRDVTRGKPAGDVFLLAAERLKLDPKRCIVVEDAPVGVEAAHRAGMAVVAVNGTVSSQKLSAADLVVDSLRRLSPEIFVGLIDRAGGK